MLQRLLVLALLLIWRPVAAQQPDSIEVVFFNVGQGEAVLVRSFEGRAALIDAGGNSSILDHLRQFLVDSLDLVIASHPHRDHIGGMPTVLGKFAVAAYMDNGQRYKSEDWNLTEWFLEQMNVPRTAARADTFALGSTSLRILPPPGLGGHTNNESVGVLLEFGKFRALFTGDSEYEELQHFLSLGMPTVTLMKAAHHGSRNGLTPGWAEATKPEVVVISVGKNNSYGHPASWVLRYYGLYTKAIYRTDNDGTIRVIGYKDGTWRVETAAVELGARPAATR